MQGRKKEAQHRSEAGVAVGAVWRETARGEGRAMVRHVPQTRREEPTLSSSSFSAIGFNRDFGVYLTAAEMRVHRK